MIVTFLLAGSGLRIVLSYPAVETRHWALLGLVLWCCILTRHINAVFAAVLPTTIGVLMLGRFRAVFSRRESEGGRPQSDILRPARVCAISLAIGLASLLFATASTHLLCRRAGISWRPKFGYTFLWRLNFLEPMPSSERNALLDATAAKSTLPEAPRMFALLSASFSEPGGWDPQTFVRMARPLFSAPPHLEGQQVAFDLLLNDMGRAFLKPPSPPLRSVAIRDFAASTRLTEGEVARYLVATTNYFFSHPDQMPQCAKLATFRGPAGSLLELGECFYFRFWSWFSFRAWSVIWLIVLGLSVVLNRRQRVGLGRVIVYAVCLCLTGILMVLLNCFFAQMQPRFALPMMELLFVSLVILLGTILNAFAGDAVPAAL